jgi:hypothetical protein
MRAAVPVLGGLNIANGEALAVSDSDRESVESIEDFESEEQRQFSEGWRGWGEEEVGVVSEEKGGGEEEEGKGQMVLRMRVVSRSSQQARSPRLLQATDTALL